MESPSNGALLKQSVRRGARVAFVAQIVSQLISLLVLATLYRQLSTADYGLFGVVVPMLMLLRNLTTVGLGVAAVQRPGMPTEISNALFWWNVWIGSATTLLTAVAAPIVAWLYGSADAGWVTVSLAGTSLVALLGTQHQALLERRLAWNSLALTRLWAQAAAGFVAVQLALRGAGVWSLVAQQYVEAAVTTALVWRYEAWRPSRPRHNPESLQLLGFGSHFAGAGLMFFLAGNIDKLLVGALLKSAGQVAAGYYTQAFNFMMRPVYLLTTPLNNLMLLSLARARDNVTAFREIYLGFQRLIAVVMFPVSAGLCVTAPDAMLLLGGSEWSDAGQALRALAPTILVQGFINTASSALAAVGRADGLFAASVWFAAVMSAMSFGILYGFQGDPETMNILATAFSATSILVFIPYQAWCLRTLGVHGTAWLKLIARPLLASLAMGVCVMATNRTAFHWTGQMPSTKPGWVFTSLCVQVSVGVFCYLILAWPDCRWLWGQLRRETNESVGGGE